MRGASLIFAPVGALVPLALEATVKGGCVICAGIHVSDIPGFPYRLLWSGQRRDRAHPLTIDPGCLTARILPGTQSAISNTR